MRSTVGPLPPAVYWRRRAVVLGALLLVAIVLFVSCSGGGDDANKRGAGKGGTAASQPPTPAPDQAGGSPEPETSFTDDNPPERPLPDPEDLQSGAPGGGPSGGTANGTNNNVTAPTDGSCADQDVSLVPLPAATTVKSGVPVQIKIKIKNVSTRACTRDLGAGAQELYLVQGARKFWSSDQCSTDRSANKVTMQPGAEYEFSITWNGRQSTTCAGGMPNGAAPPAGHYELRARLDRKLSDPVTLSVSA